MKNNELRPYEEYKDMDLPWIKQVPAHWCITRNKNLMEQKKTLVGDTYADYRLLSLTINGIIERDMVNPKGKFPKDFDTYQMVNENDLIFCLFDIDETPRTVGLSRINGMITGAYTVFNVIRTNARYLYYYYLALDNNKLMKPLYTGLRKVISIDRFLRTKLPIPPLEEQDKIVKYLDYKLTKINKFIKARKKMIVVLKEQKQAIINEAVTKGLNRDVKMKQSGNDYIGLIPTGWSMGKVGYIGTLQNGISEAGSFFECGYPFVGYGDVYNNFQLPLKVDGVANSNIKQQETYSVKSGDVFFTRTSETIEEIGISSVCFSDIDKAIFSGFLIRFRPNSGVFSKKFSKYYFRNDLIRNYFIKEMNIVTRASLSQSLLRNLPVILPPMDEQEKIGEFLDNESMLIDKAIERIIRQVELISEYKNTLIFNVVTGKVDVRNIQIEDYEIEDNEADIEDNPEEEYEDSADNDEGGED